MALASVLVFLFTLKSGGGMAGLSETVLAADVVRDSLDGHGGAIPVSAVTPDEELLAPVRERDGLVVELGCGSGLLTRFLVDAGHRVVATDASPAMLDLARAYATGAREIRELVLRQQVSRGTFIGLGLCLLGGAALIGQSLQADPARIEGDLYGRRIEVDLISFIRPEERFEDLEALKAQMARDGEEARRGDEGSVGIVVEPHHRPAGERERGKGADDRPGIRIEDVIGVVVGPGHCFPSGLCRRL